MQRLDQLPSLSRYKSTPSRTTTSLHLLLCKRLCMSATHTSTYMHSKHAHTPHAQTPHTCTHAHTHTHTHAHIHTHTHTHTRTCTQANINGLTVWAGAHNFLQTPCAWHTSQLLALCTWHTSQLMHTFNHDSHTQSVYSDWWHILSYSKAGGSGPAVWSSLV